LFQGSWERPPNSAGLRCTARIVISDDGRFSSLSITRASGNAEFDRSVQNVLDRFEGRMAPPIPEEEREQFVGHSRPIRFEGR
jgi:TonB family protein